MVLQPATIVSAGRILLSTILPSNHLGSKLSPNKGQILNSSPLKTMPLHITAEQVMWERWQLGVLRFRECNIEAWEMLLGCAGSKVWGFRECRQLLLACATQGSVLEYDECQKLMEGWVIMPAGHIRFECHTVVLHTFIASSNKHELPYIPLLLYNEKIQHQLSNASPTQPCHWDSTWVARPNITETFCFLISLLGCVQ